MHFMPDTEDADSAAETFWPEGYKKVIRDDLRRLIADRLNGGKSLVHIYRQQYPGKDAELNQFINKIADMVAIGAENGADDAFEEMIDSFLTESPLPDVRRYARYFRPQAVSADVRRKLQRVIVEEYSQDNIYSYAYKVGYQKKFRDFGGFLEQVAELAITGASNGADDMLEAIYRSFLASRPLPQARRRPRRLKNWWVSTYK